MNVKQRIARRMKMKEKALKYRQEYWGEVTDEDLWFRREQDGFVTTPRTMPIIINIIDVLTKKASAGYTFFCLWCRSYDEQVIEVGNTLEFAVEAGFSGERAVSTWRKRIQQLETLGFIRTHAGIHEYEFILLLNPHRVIRGMKKDVQKNLYAQLLRRGLEIGARDFFEDDEETNEVKSKEKGKEQVKAGKQDEKKAPEKSKAKGSQKK